MKLLGISAFKMNKQMIIECQECGERVKSDELHTYQNCLIYKKKLTLVELSRLQEKFNK